jgi:hypothetical protein
MKKYSEKDEWNRVWKLSLIALGILGTTALLSYYIWTS